MPQQPSQSQVHIDAILSQISVAYIQNQDFFIADKVFPAVPVDKQSNLYFKYTKNDWFRDEAQKRAGGTETVGSGYGLQTDNYFCPVYGIHKDVDDQTRANADTPLDMDRDSTMFVTQRLLLRREVQWAADCFVTGVWGTDNTVTNTWDNYQTSDPVGDIETGKLTILQNTGFLPNTLTLGYPVYRWLRNHPDLIDRVKYNGEKTVTDAALAQVFGVDRIVTAKGVKANNNEGETASYSLIHGKNALLSYVNPQPGLLAPSAGYSFFWKGVSGGLGLNVGIRQFRLEWLKADRIEGEIAFVNKIVAPDLGYFFPNVTAT